VIIGFGQNSNYVSKLKKKHVIYTQRGIDSRRLKQENESFKKKKLCIEYVRTK